MPVRDDATATRAFHPRLAVVFDFDRTLAPSTIDTLLDHCGLDADEFREREEKPLIEEGWDALLAQAWALARHGRRHGRPITRDDLLAAGRAIELYPGVPDLFERLRACAANVLEPLEVEFYVLTCGFVQMHRAHPVSEHFREMWGSELHFDDEGAIVAARQMITFPEKTRYLLQLAKGLGTRGANTPSDVYRDVPDEELYVPLSQMIYVGDGASDMPSFALMQDHGGIALGVVDDEAMQGWSGYDRMRAARRVQNLAPGDYRDGSELRRSLELAVESSARLAALRGLSVGE